MLSVIQDTTILTIQLLASTTTQSLFILIYICNIAIKDPVLLALSTLSIIYSGVQNLKDLAKASDYNGDQNLKYTK